MQSRCYASDQDTVRLPDQSMAGPLIIGASGRRYWRKAAANMLFVDVNCRVLLVLRSQRVDDPNTWGIPGGYADATESFQEAAVREIREELGTFPYNGHIIDHHDYVDDPFVCRTFVWKFEGKPDWCPRVDGDECLAMKWFETSGVLSIPLYWHTKAVLEHFGYETGRLLSQV